MNEVITIDREFPTWTVKVDGETRFSGLWRRSTAEALAFSVTHPAPHRASRVRRFVAHAALMFALVLAQHERHEAPAAIQARSHGAVATQPF